MLRRQNGTDILEERIKTNPNIAAAASFPETARGLYGIIRSFNRIFILNFNEGLHSSDLLPGNAF